MNMNKVSSILKRCIFFEKIAGLVKIPEVSADEINDFIIQLFAKNVINESGDDKLIKYLCKSYHILKIQNMMKLLRI